MRLTFPVLFLLGIVGSVYTKTVTNEILKGMMSHPNISIIGGTEAQSGEFPYMAIIRLVSNGTGRPRCGGTLIASSYILTAGHCVEGLPNLDSNTYLTVDMNTLNVNGGGPGSVTRKISSIIKHKNYLNDGTVVLNDISLLVLAKPVTAADNIPFVQFPKDEPVSGTLQCTCTQTGTTNNGASLILTCTCTPNAMKTPTKKPTLKVISNYGNMSAVITGWGKTASNGASSSTLLKANVIVNDNSVCKSQWGDSFDGSKQLCAGNETTVVCKGDSGGPILVGGNVQIGISSFVSAVDCANPFRNPVFTRVSAYLDWIKEAMDNNPPPAKGK